ncbi:MAG: fumarylacetoacetase [Armatimonadetes bacterium]|nr:fumarylacetoacetase [Armatimonadota bacterium]
MKLVIPASAESWVDAVQVSDFPIQNLPTSVVDSHLGRVLAVRIGDFALLMDEKLMPDQVDAHGRAIRAKAYELLSDSSSALAKDNALKRSNLVPIQEVQPVVDPSTIPAFVDFYSGIYHATNVGKMFRPENAPLLPNYKSVPIAYNGRSTSLIGSDAPIFRPKGQVKPADGPPEYVPTRELDFELEFGYFLAGGNPRGSCLAPDAAEAQITGFVLVNDWSARDVQRWEYQPLGPFLAKSFATSISEWRVHPDAIELFRLNGIEQDPAPLPHLATSGRQHYDIHLEVWLQSAEMTSPQRICHSNTKHLYWSFAQQIAHQASNGTPIVPGELYATGTISGPDEGMFGSMLELSWRGSRPITLHETGELRTFLLDGDTVIFRGWAQGEGYRVGFGELRNTVVGS